MDQFNLMSATIERLQNSMRAEVVQKSQQLTRSEHLASVGCLAAGLAHEMNNPLGIITGYAQTCLRQLDEQAENVLQQQAIKQARETLTIVCEEAFRCSDVAGQLLQLAQPSQGPYQRIHMDTVARRAVELAQRLPGAKSCRLTYEPRGDPSELVCWGERAQLLQVLMNLLTNALEACAPVPDGRPLPRGRVVLSILRRMDMIIITIDDNGCGMSEETLARAFDPFFTDKSRRGLSGSGLGLSLCHATIEQHRGRISAGSDGPRRGSTLTVELPVATGDLAGPQVEARRAGAV
jgi:signal transduction histidine kinase